MLRFLKFKSIIIIKSIKSPLYGFISKLLIGQNFKQKSAYRAINSTFHRPTLQIRVFIFCSKSLFLFDLFKTKPLINSPSKPAILNLSSPTIAPTCSSSLKLKTVTDWLDFLFLVDQKLNQIAPLLLHRNNKSFCNYLSE